jgi:hypothetical protein
MYPTVVGLWGCPKENQLALGVQRRKTGQKWSDELDDHRERDRYWLNVRKNSLLGVKHQSSGRILHRKAALFVRVDLQEDPDAQSKSIRTRKRARRHSSPKGRGHVYLIKDKTRPWVEDHLVCYSSTVARHSESNCWRRYFTDWSWLQSSFLCWVYFQYCQYDV